MMAESDNGSEYVDVLRYTLAAYQKIMEKTHWESRALAMFPDTSTVPVSLRVPAYQEGYICVSPHHSADFESRV